jgi:hypothetical protein
MEMLGITCHTADDRTLRLHQPREACPDPDPGRISEDATPDLVSCIKGNICGEQNSVRHRKNNRDSRLNG